MTNVLVKERRGHTDRPREGGYVQTEIREMQPQAKDSKSCGQPPAAERGLEGTQTLPRSLQKQPAL